MLLSQDAGTANSSHVSSVDYVSRLVRDGQHTVESSTDSIPVHPLGVKPLGNQYFASERPAREALGAIGILPDELIQPLLEYLDEDSLRYMGTTCRFLYAFCRLDELWKGLYLETQAAGDPILPWQGTWRSTLLGLQEKSLTKIECRNVFSDVLHRPFACSHVKLHNYVASIPPRNQITRLVDLTAEQFVQNWSEKPFILKDYVQRWPVSKSWTVDYFDKEFSNVKFRAEAVDWPFSAYNKYMSNNDDESPLYLFDRRFAEKIGIAVAGETPHSSYWAPECFGTDLFQALDEERPAHRWLIIGPERSGSTFHKDPNGTSAWNAVIQGSKYWLMFPPTVAQPPGVFVSQDSSEVTSPLSITEYLLTFHEEARKEAGCVEGICRAGELLFVPSGWWHLVVNLEPGIALTQNFVTNSRKHLTQVLMFLRDKTDQVTGFSKDIGSPYELFVERLKEKYPGLLQEALNEMERRSGGRKRRWEDAVGASTAGSTSNVGFSFGFGGGDDDEIP